MVSPEPSSPCTSKPTIMAPKSTARTPKPSLLADGFLFAGGAAVALLLFWVFCSLVIPTSSPSLYPNSSSFSIEPRFSSGTGACGERHHDPPSPTFYDDPSLGYTIDSRLTNWDEKRREWLHLHPSFDQESPNRVLLLSGSQSQQCKNPIGDHLLLRFFKNKLDYCRIHGYDFFYNTALFHPERFTYWAKIPTIRAAMVAHPEVEWIYWVDSDAAFTDMEFKLPLSKYSNHNMVVHGWPHLVYEKKSWTSLNAGVFLIRNCQWSLDFMDVWASTGPQTTNYDDWGKTLRSELADKTFPESDDQSTLVYLLLKEKEKWGSKIYLENEYCFEGYWVDIVGRLENITAKYAEMERRVAGLRRRHAEKVADAYAAAREGELNGVDGWRRPFITHFTGCQPCSGDHNKFYSGKNCYDGMVRALNFADDQVLRVFGFGHPDLLSTSDVRPLPFDFPSTGSR